MATVEFAVAMPAIVAVLALLLGSISLGIDHIRCVDAARAGARLLARGDAAAAQAEAVRLAPQGAVVASGSHGAEVTMTVTGTIPIGLSWLGAAVAPNATATATSEAGLHQLESP